MSNKFPKPIIELPEADIPLNGVKAYLSQAKNHQIIFMEFEKDVKVPEHSHESQWEIVLDGKVDVWIEGEKNSFIRGDSFFIPKDAKHHAQVYAGYRSIAFFNQKDRYKQKL